jgi:hypothetical protein
MPNDPSTKYSVMQAMRKLMSSKPTKMEGAGPRRDKKLADAEAKGLNMKGKK